MPMSIPTLDPRLIPHIRGSLDFSDSDGLDHFRVRQDYFELSSTDKLSGGPFVRASGSVKHFLLRYEALLESPSTPAGLYDGQPWESLRAIGVQLDLEVTTSRADLKADVYSVALAV